MVSGPGGCCWQVDWCIPLVVRQVLPRRPEWHAAHPEKSQPVVVEKGRLWAALWRTSSAVRHWLQLRYPWRSAVTSDRFWTVDCSRSRPREGCSEGRSLAVPTLSCGEDAASRPARPRVGVAASPADGQARCCGARGRGPSAAAAGLPVIECLLSLRVATVSLLLLLAHLYFMYLT